MAIRADSNRAKKRSPSTSKVPTKEGPDVREAVRLLKQSGAGRDKAIRALVSAGDAKAAAALLAQAMAKPRTSPNDAYYREKFRLELAVLATRHVATIAEWVAKRIPADATARGCGTTVSGLLLRDASGIPFPRNPWGITSKMTLRHAIDHVWGATARRAPTFVGTLREQLLGLALLTHGKARGAWLGYILLHPRDRYELQSLKVKAPAPTHHDLSRLLDWLDYAAPTIVAGAPPATPTELRPNTKRRIPAPLSELYAIHAGICAGIPQLYGPTELEPLAGLLGSEGAVFAERNGGRDANTFLPFFHYGDADCDVFDLETKARDGAPVVMGWCHEGWEVGPALRAFGEDDEPDGPVSFWRWFDSALSRQMLHVGHDEP